MTKSSRPSHQAIADFIGALKSTRFPNTFNPWRDRDPRDLGTDPPGERRQRLAAFLEVDPFLVALGEAPGYQGAHFTGLPFTSEALIMEGAIPRLPPRHGCRLTTRATPWSEPSARIVWEILYREGLAERVVLWNAFPVHPHPPGEPLKNRAPTAAEREEARPLLSQFLTLYPGVPVVGIGRQAAETLASLGVHCLEALRHPSYGGKPAFAKGMASLAQRLGRER